MKKLLLLCLLFLSITSFSQITTASLTGVTKDSKDTAVPFSTVQLIYTSTGVKYGMAADADGVFKFYNINAGGPYQIIVSSVGYKNFVKDDVYLKLGDNDLTVILSEDSKELEAVVVTGTTKKSETTLTLNQNTLSSTPTLSRGITDFTKLVPQSVNNSFGGTNFRYNNVTIDGTINNDAIGFSPALGGQTGTSGMPGSSTRTSPISIDAIQDIQVYVAPYDVKIGNFLGGSINAITRSGTNKVEGSVYLYGRNANLTGFKTTKDYSDAQTGFRIGLPIVKDKLFLFSNFTFGFLVSQ